MKHEVALTTLGKIAEDAREGLRMVARGENHTMAGWLLYGEALNDGRKMFPSNNLFHEWMVSQQLDGTEDMERAAGGHPRPSDPPLR